MRARAKKKLRLRRVIPAAVFLFFVCLFLLIALCRQVSLPGLSEWHDANGTSVDLMKQADLKKGEVRTIYVTLPPNADGHTLAVRAENVTLRIWAGTILLYQTPESDLSAASGDRLILLTLPSHSGGALLGIEATAPLHSGCRPIRRVYYGESLTVLNFLMRSAIPSLLLNGALLFSGFVLSLSVFFRDGHHSLAGTWLGLAVMALSGWTMTQAYIVLASELTSFLFLACMYLLLPLTAAFFFAYLASCSAGSRKHVFLYYTAAVACGGWGLLCIALDKLKTAPFPSTRPFSLLLLGVASAAMLANFAMPLHEKQRVSLHLPGFLILLCGECIDGIRLCLCNTLDYAVYTRVGLMAFVVCISLENVRGISHSIRQAARADALQRAAYLDALTGLYNRRAYQRDFSGLENSSSDIAIVMMDIDELKHANDVYGHKQGDELICAAARVISVAFEGCGDCYRYGGDEFVALVRQNADACDAAIRRIARLSEAENHMNSGMHPPLHISTGYALYRPGRGRTIAEAQKLADERMYANKKQRKACRA
jgi:diguanylate cyclase (GGDEF)-like protein